MTRKTDAYLDPSHTRGKLASLAVRGGALTALSRIIRAVIEIGSVFVLARLLSPATFGLFGMAALITRMIELVRDLGLSAATVQRAEINHAQVSALFWINALAGLCFALLALASAPILAWFFGEQQLVRIVAGLSISFLLSGLAVQHLAVLKRQMRFGVIGTIEVAAGLSGAVAAISIALSGGGYWALVAAPVVGSLVSVISAWAICPFRPDPPRRGADIAALLSFGGNLVAFNMVNFFARNLDDILIGRFVGARALGIYQKSYELMMLPLKQLNTPLGAVTVPTLSRLMENPAKYRAAYLRALDTLLLVTTPLTAAMVGNSQDVIRVLLGPAWSDAAPIFTVLGLSLLTQPVSNSTGWAFISQARTGEMLRYGIFASLTAAASFAVGFSWGTIGIAWAFTIGQLGRTPILIYILTRTGPIRARDIYTLLRTYMLVWVTAVAVTHLAHKQMGLEPGLLGLVIGATIAALTSAAVLFALPSGRASIRATVTLIRQLRATDGA